MCRRKPLRTTRPTLLLAAALLAAPALLVPRSGSGSGGALGKEDPRVCGNLEGAICCESWGNTCIDPELTCCPTEITVVASTSGANGTTSVVPACVAAPFNSSNPQAACGTKGAKPKCTFDQMLVKTGKWDSANAYVLNAISKAVYPDTWSMVDEDASVGRAFSTWAQGYGITNATFLSAYDKRHEVDTEGVCMRDDKGNVFVVFRGTSSATDVATDADFIGSIKPARNTMFGGKSVNIHDGFSDAYKPVREAMLSCVQGHMEHFAELRRAGVAGANSTAGGSNSTPKPMVWVGGHSLGAALATLAATDLAQKHYQPVVYLIGSPRVGDKDFVRLYDEELGLKNRTFRQVNENDPVARVPVQALGYRHVGTRVDLNATRGTCLLPSAEVDCTGKCVVNDHYTDPYMNATMRCVEGDGSIDTLCPLETIPTSYNLMAATPGQGTLANESDAVLAAAAAADGKGKGKGESSAQGFMTEGPAVSKAAGVGRARLPLLLLWQAATWCLRDHVALNSAVGPVSC